MKPDRIVNIASESSLALALIFAPVAFGAVHAITYSILNLFLLSVFMLCAAYGIVKRPLNDGLLVLCGLFIAFVSFAVLQAIPLDNSLIERLSPKAAEIYKDLIPGYNDAANAGSASHSLSLNSYATKTELVKVMAYFSAFLLASTFTGRGAAVRLSLIIAAVGFFEAIYGLYGYFSNAQEMLGYKKIYNFDAATGTYINRNHFAGLLGLVIPLSTGLLIGYVQSHKKQGLSVRENIASFSSSPHAFKTVLLLISITLMGVGMSFSLSRSAVASLIAAMLAMALVSLSRGRKAAVKVMLIAGLLGVLAAMWYGIEPIEGRFRDSAGHFQKGRAVVWQSALKMAGGFPVAGTGLGTFEDSYRLYKPDEIARMRVSFDHAHNDYIELLTDAGYAGSLLLASLFALYAVLLYRGRHTRRSPLESGIMLGAVGSMIYMALHSLTDFNMHIPANALYLSIIMGIAFSLTAKRESNAVILPRVLLAAFVIYALYGVSISAVRIRSEAAYPSERSIFTGSSSLDAPDMARAALIEEAVSINPDAYQYSIMLGKYYISAGDAKRAKEHLSTAAGLNPAYTEANAYLAWTDFMSGRPYDALDRLDKAISNDPYNYFLHAYFGIAVASFIDRFPQGQKQIMAYRAADEIDKGISLNPLLEEHPTIIGSRAMLMDTMGRRQDAVLEFEKLRALNTGTLGYYIRLAELYSETGSHAKASGLYAVLISFKGAGDEGLKNVAASLEGAMRISQQTEELKFLLGRAYFDLRDWHRAVSALKDVSSVRQAAEAHYISGLAYENMGQPSKAYEEFLDALKASRYHRGAGQKVLEYTQKRH